MTIVKGPIKPFSGITNKEIAAAIAAVDGGPLSGYLAGKERGGANVRALENEWAEMFHVKHAVAVNSATSGLLAACRVCGVRKDTLVATTPFTMSATAAAPALLGANLAFCDIEEETFGLSEPLFGDGAQAVITTNLFGHPAGLTEQRRRARTFGRYLIEDNAQSPFAMERGRYAGTFGHIGVWSLNVHKPIQCGEGGICTTDDDHLAAGLRGFINHGENLGHPPGLNLRMPEVCAAIALTQLRRAEWLVSTRVAQAEAIIKEIGDIPGIRPPVVKEGCSHVYYTIPFLVDYKTWPNRAGFVDELRDEGVPVVEGYVDPLYRLPAFKKWARSCPNAEEMQDRRLFYIENCAYDFAPDQIKQIGDAFRKAARCLSSM